MPLVRVELGARSYEVAIGPQMFAACARFLAAGGYSSKALLITDQTVDRLYAEDFGVALREAGVDFDQVTLPAGEEAKSLQWAGRVYDAAVAGKLDRKSPFVALGGGVVGDLAGFAAATYLRGVPFVQVPTTLLAQVDASVGGKVAVNHPAGKNLIGAFHQPDAVFADLAVLKTLSGRDYASGLAEVVKCACLAGGDFLEFLRENTEAIKSREPATLGEIVVRCCRYKAQIVAADERETGARMFLNFGHTYAHAIEAEGDFSLYTHGEAVAIGLTGALLLSEKFAGLDAGVSRQVCALLADFGLPLHSSGLKPDKIYAALWHDKKALNGQLQWVLLQAPGRPLVSKAVPNGAVREALEEIAR